ncbi:hypothetical protein Emtol_3035 [Emticicia oligotrophica DSM 17448]|uniref:Outer membrane protein beta-barrel domain-containing protein n=1 Tax=Emticicia oligotrophica (strain DSM 17448 / CIP 109782 / MTCC 6937 / GPTSA100-15) TaxID=929562 RepID=A0ABN4AP47_EMTOG|nr:hypothetical protein [Emticicia oligotrophica]AFK04168.1 hypothetical protein Emtol_3035 [Emticicia oligotrophica DSM 17448]
MKKLLFIYAFLLILSDSFAQAEYHTPFRWDIGMHYARPKNYGFGLGIYTEPKYLINDNVSVGMRIEGTVLGRLKVNNSGESGGSLGWVSSFLAISDYHFGDSHFRPTMGLGLGLFRPTAASYNVGDNYPELARGGKFGISPRFGIDLWHFRLSADYNFIFGQRNLIDGQKIDLNQNHLTIKMGIFFGGGLKKE